jgi:hypothetical protein
MKNTTTLSLLSVLTLGFTGCSDNQEVQNPQIAEAKLALELKTKLASNISLKEFLVLAEKLSATDELHQEFTKLLENSKTPYQDLVLLTYHLKSQSIIALCSVTQKRNFNRTAAGDYHTHDESKFLTDPVRKALFSIDSEFQFNDLLNTFINQRIVTPDVGAFYQTSHAALLQEKHRNDNKAEQKQPPKTSGISNCRDDWTLQIVQQKQQAQSQPSLHIG